MEGDGSGEEAERMEGRPTDEEERQRGRHQGVGEEGGRDEERGRKEARD